MGASQSSSATTPKQGLHVLRVAPGSPADGTEIEPYFSFLVGFEGFQGGQSGSLEAAELERIVEAHEGRTLTLHVWNSKYRETKSVSITPSKTWNARAASEHEPQPSQLLGLSVRLCQPEFAMDNVWHVLDVAEGSPAESAGLVPMGDWVLGWSGGVLSAENDFYDLVEAHVDKPLRVYVYSYDFDALREVVLIPNRHWGGDGLLGCVFGFGLLHRIPIQHQGDRQNILPAELLENEHDLDQELFIPAETLDSTMPYTPSQPASYAATQPMPPLRATSDEPESPIPGSFQHIHTPPRVASPRQTPIETPTPKRPHPLSHSHPSTLRSPLGNGVKNRVFSPPVSSRHSPSRPIQQDDEDDNVSETSID